MKEHVFGGSMPTRGMIIFDRLLGELFHHQERCSRWIEADEKTLKVIGEGKEVKSADSIAEARTTNSTTPHFLSIGTPHLVAKHRNERRGCYRSKRSTR